MVNFFFKVLGKIKKYGCGFFQNESKNENYECFVSLQNICQLDFWPIIFCKEMKYKNNYFGSFKDPKKNIEKFS